MSVHAGTIIHVGGANVIDRIQSAGLGDVRLPIETIREVGNRLVVDKVPGEPDFTFTMEALDVSTDIMAFLNGKVGGSASGSAPGASDPAGTEYKFEDCQFVNIPSPWKNPAAGSAGTVVAGHLVPGFYPTRVRYRFGVTDNAVQEVELAGGSFYYGKFAPVEEYATGNGATVAFATSENAIKHRKGGPNGTTFRSVFGVIVDGVLAIEDVDYTVAGGASGPAGSVATITFAVAPANGAKIRFAYFTATAKAYPQSVHASSITKPGAVRGKHIGIFLGSGGSRARVASVQSVELEGSVESEVEREMGSDQIVGLTINGRDATGTITVRSKDAQAFLDLLTKVTGVSQDEIFGYFNLEGIPLEIVIFNPKDPGGTPLKTLWVSDAQFQPPGTPARVNSPTDFALSFESKDGTFSEFKGAKP
jgi:hypothetical protein